MVPPNNEMQRTRPGRDGASPVGIELRCACGRWRVTIPALSVAEWVHSSTMATFPKAPLRSRTVGFPESGSDPGLSPWGLSAGGVAQALTRLHPARSRFAPRLAPAYRNRATRPCVRTLFRRRSRQAPRAPLPEPGVTGSGAASSAASGGVGSLARSYRLMRQATPLPSPSVFPPASGLRRLQSAPAAAWPFPTLFRIPFPTCLDPYSGCLWSALARFFPQSLGLPRDQRRVGATQQTGERLLAGTPFRSCSHSFTFRPAGLLATQVAPTASHCATSGRGFSIRASRDLLPPRAPDMLAVRIGRLTAGDLHPIGSTALLAAP